MIGRVIRTARGRLGWSQRELAAACHVSQAAIAKLEAGTTFPGPQLLESLLNVLDLAPLTEKPQPHREPPENPPPPETTRLRREQLTKPPEPEDESQEPPDW